MIREGALDNVYRELRSRGLSSKQAHRSSSLLRERARRQVTTDPAVGCFPAELSAAEEARHGAPEKMSLNLKPARAMGYLLMATHEVRCTRAVLERDSQLVDQEWHAHWHDRAGWPGTNASRTRLWSNRRSTISRAPHGAASSGRRRRRARLTSWRGVPEAGRTRWS